MGTETQPVGEFRTLLTEEIGCATRPANALLEEHPTLESALEVFVDDGRFGDIPGVGRRTTSRLFEWLIDTYPEKNRTRKANSEAYCTTFTTDHEYPTERMDDPDRFHWAWICPRDGHKNVMVGDPRESANRPYACVNCRWVPLLDREALLEWIDTEGLEDQLESEGDNE